MSRFQTVNDVWNYLDSIPMFGISGSKAMKPGLEAIQKALDEIDNPERNFKSIHIAGTNGKGTTARMLEAIYQSAGYKTGVFTSPHLLKYNERIRIDGDDISDLVLVEIFHDLEKVLGQNTLTFFEISTMAAFWAFSNAKVDIGIVEVGLGGRFDSTNVIEPEASVITSIGLDHQDILGDTLEEIAAEKAGIIKPTVPVVIGNVEPEPFRVIQDIAREKGSEAYVSKPESIRERIQLKLSEEVNYWNAAVALKVTQLLSSNMLVDKETAINALNDFEGMPARFEKLRKDRDWYFSGAHNLQAVTSTMEGVKSLGSGKRTLVLSLMKDKVNKDLAELFTGFESIFYYDQETERSASLEDVSELMDAQMLSNSNATQILNELKSEVVIFCGKFFTFTP